MKRWLCPLPTDDLTILFLFCGAKMDFDDPEVSLLDSKEYSSSFSTQNYLFDWKVELSPLARSRGNFCLRLDRGCQCFDCCGRLSSIVLLKSCIVFLYSTLKDLAAFFQTSRFWKAIQCDYHRFAAWIVIHRGHLCCQCTYSSENQSVQGVCLAWEGTLMASKTSCASRTAKPSSTCSFSMASKLKAKKFC